MSTSSSPLRQIVLKQPKKRSFGGNHPWILDHSLHTPISEPKLGEIVELVRDDGKFIGRGLYNPSSRIKLRLYTWNQEDVIDHAFFKNRVDRAIEHRARMVKTSGSSLRLLFSEADGISGLVADKFGEHIVLQVTSAALLPYVDEIAQRLFDLYRPLSISLQIDAKTAKSEGIEPESKFIVGAMPSEPIEIVENDLKWRVDLNAGQKTGYYLDQRENRAAVTRWIPENADVLDVCTYVGGFALTVAKHCKTNSITAVDSSEKALSSAKEHANLNDLNDRVNWVQSDFFEYLSNQLDSGAKYDAIILDPPRLASNRDHIERAKAAYHRLNYLALRMLRPGGTLVTCSCSGRVSRQDFMDVLGGASQRARREMQILEERGAAPDHPHLLSCPETDYLKCVIARVV